MVSLATILVRRSPTIVPSESTASTHVPTASPSDSLAWFPVPYRMPGSSVAEILLAQISDLNDTLQSLSTTVHIPVDARQPFVNVTTTATAALCALASIFNPTPITPAEQNLPQPAPRAEQRVLVPIADVPQSPPPLPLVPPAAAQPDVPTSPPIALAPLPPYGVPVPAHRHLPIANVMRSRKAKHPDAEPSHQRLAPQATTRPAPPVPTHPRRHFLFKPLDRWRNTHHA